MQRNPDTISGNCVAHSALNKFQVYKNCRNAFVNYLSNTSLCTQHNYGHHMAADYVLWYICAYVCNHFLWASYIKI